MLVGCIYISVYCTGIVIIFVFKFADGALSLIKKSEYARLHHLSADAGRSTPTTLMKPRLKYLRVCWLKVRLSTSAPLFYLRDAVIAHW